MRPWQGEQVSDPGEPIKEQAPSRRRNFWQLDIPMVFAVILCSVFTVIEVRRIGEGVWRAWAYAFEWPMIGLFCVWIWYRYRKEGSVTKGFAARWQARVARLSAASDELTGALEHKPEPVDPARDSWEAYVADLQRREPPGRSPDESAAKEVEDR